MDRKTFPNTNITLLLLAISVIGILCLVVVLPLNTQFGVVGSRHLFWFQLITIGPIIIGIGVLFLYETKRIRSLHQQVAQNSEELKKSEEKYRSLVESTEDFIFTVDKTGHFQSLNSFTANFFGGNSSSLLDSPYLFFSQKRSLFSSSSLSMSSSSS